MRRLRGWRRYVVYGLWIDNYQPLGTPIVLSSCVYIGMSGQNMKERARQHRDGKDARLKARILVKGMTREEALYVEARMKHRIKEELGAWPRYNIEGCEAGYGHCPVCTRTQNSGLDTQLSRKLPGVFGGLLADVL